MNADQTKDATVISVSEHLIKKSAELKRLAAAQAHEGSVTSPEESAAVECKNGVCELKWKPSSPAA